MKTLSIQCPDRLADELERLVREGWIVSPAEGALEALRRFLDSHRPDLVCDQVKTDVEWGLHGTE